MIAVATLLVVKRYGFEVKRMWGGSTRQLSVLDQALAGGELEPGPGPGIVTPSDPSEPEPVEPAVTDDGDENDCANRKAALLAERDRELARLDAELNAATQEYQRVNTGHREYVGRRGRWGRGGGWRFVYDYPAAVRNAAHQRVVAARQARNRFLGDWSQRYRDWQRECGG